jgi:hypothetical protein
MQIFTEISIFVSKQNPYITGKQVPGVEPVTSGFNREVILYLSKYGIYIGTF